METPVTKTAACTLELRARRGHEPGTEQPATGLGYVDAGEYLAWINGPDRGTPSGCPQEGPPEWAFMARDVLFPTSPIRSSPTPR